MRLLNKTRLTAAEIANKTGFVDASSFAEQFKRWTGATSTEYRAKQARLALWYNHGWADEAVFDPSNGF